VACFLAAVLTEIYLRSLCSGQAILSRNGRGPRRELPDGSWRRDGLLIMWTPAERQQGGQALPPLGSLALQLKVGHSGWLLSRRGRGSPANASGFDSHRDSLSSRFATENRWGSPDPRTRRSCGGTGRRTPRTVATSSWRCVAQCALCAYIWDLVIRTEDEMNRTGGKSQPLIRFLS
jgi:hypothetical protein